MATLADELAAEFADSGSENGGSQDDEENDSDALAPNGKQNGAGDNDSDMEQDDDENAAHPEGLPGEAPEETEARLKTQKKDIEGPADMRKVLKFTASMEPVLEVSNVHPHKSYRILRLHLRELVLTTVVF